jgi:hypothetical protein
MVWMDHFVVLNYFTLILMILSILCSKFLYLLYSLGTAYVCTVFILQSHYLLLNMWSAWLQDQKLAQNVNFSQLKKICIIWIKWMLLNPLPSGHIHIDVIAMPCVVNRSHISTFSFMMSHTLISQLFCITCQGYKHLEAGCLGLMLQTLRPFLTPHS